MEEEGELPAVVISATPETIQCGFAGDDAPRYSELPHMGRVKSSMTTASARARVCYGSACRRGIIVLSKPFAADGSVSHWNDAALIITHAMGTLRVDPSQHAAVVLHATLPPPAPSVPIPSVATLVSALAPSEGHGQIQKPPAAAGAKVEEPLDLSYHRHLASVGFKVTDVVPRCAAALTDAEFSCGIVVDFRQAVTVVSVVAGGREIPHCSMTLPFGIAAAAGQYRAALAEQLGLSFTSHCERLIGDHCFLTSCFAKPSKEWSLAALLEQWKTHSGGTCVTRAEALVEPPLDGHVPHIGDEFLESPAPALSGLVPGVPAAVQRPVEYELPDGQTFVVEDAHCECLEGYFDPTGGFGADAPGVPMAIVCAAIVATDAGLFQKPLTSQSACDNAAATPTLEPPVSSPPWVDVVLTGHGAAIPGMPERLQADADSLLRAHYGAAYPSDSAVSVRVCPPAAKPGEGPWRGASLLRFAQTLTPSNGTDAA